MLWVFVSMGLVTLASALYGLLAAVQRSKMWIAPHAATLTLLVIAWITSHTTAIGCVSLFLALFLEVTYRLIGGTPKDLWEPAAPSSEESASDDGRAMEDETPVPSPAAIDNDDDNNSNDNDNNDAADPPDSILEIVAQDAPSIPAEEETDSDDACVHQPVDNAASEPFDESAPTETETPIDDAGEPMSLEPTDTESVTEVEAITEPDSVAEDVAEPAPEKPAPEEPTSEEPASEEPAPEEPPSEEPPPAETIPAFSTWALLKTPWDASANVFLASLKRGGRRDAKLISEGSPTTPITIQLGHLHLQLMAIAEPMDRQALEYGLAQSWDWPEAKDTLKQHAAQVVFTTLAGEGFCREDVVLLHREAHKAMAEFAHVAATYWRDAGKLFPTVKAIDRDGDIANEPQATDLCITYRVFPLDGEDAGRVLSDTVGLHAFDLPDIQVVSSKEPDEHVSALLYQLAQRFFAHGCSLAMGARITTPDNTQWQVEQEPSRYPPGRSVITLTPLAESERE